MTITIEISPEEEVRLRAQAQQQGQEVEVVAGALVRAGLAATKEEAEAARTTFVQRLLAQGIIPAIPKGRLGPPPAPFLSRADQSQRRSSRSGGNGGSLSG